MTGLSVECWSLPVTLLLVVHVTLLLHLVLVLHRVALLQGGVSSIVWGVQCTVYCVLCTVYSVGIEKFQLVSYCGILAMRIMRIVRID